MPSTMQASDREWIQQTYGDKILQECEDRLVSEPKCDGAYDAAALAWTVYCQDETNLRDAEFNPVSNSRAPLPASCSKRSIWNLFGLLRRER